MAVALGTAGLSTLLGRGIRVVSRHGRTFRSLHELHCFNPYWRMSSWQRVCLCLQICCACVISFCSSSRCWAASLVLINSALDREWPCSHRCWGWVEHCATFMERTETEMEMREGLKGFSSGWHYHFRGFQVCDPVIFQVCDPVLTADVEGPP